MSEALNKARAIIKTAGTALARNKAKILQRITLETHADAPRGGSNRNYFGEPRSAPGEQPAIEFGELYSRIELEGYEEIPFGGRVFVNYPFLEFGYTTRLGNRHVLEPRPMGEIALSRLFTEEGRQ